MQVVIQTKDGRDIVTGLPKGTTVTSDQLAILVARALAGQTKGVVIE